MQCPECQYVQITGDPNVITASYDLDDDAGDLCSIPPNNEKLKNEKDFFSEKRPT